MTTSQSAVAAFLDRASRRVALLGALMGAGVGLVAAVIIVVAGLATNSGETRAFALGAGLIGAAAGAVAGWLIGRRQQTAAEIERRAPQCRNVVLTAAEMMQQPERHPQYVTELVSDQAAVTVGSLDITSLFPARRALGAVAGGVLLWATAFLLMGMRDAAGRDVLTKVVRGSDEPAPIQVDIAPPAYTGRKAERLSNPARLDVIAGSRITLTIRDTSARVETVEGEVPCHPERSEGSASRDKQILRCAQDDRRYSFVAQDDGFIAVRASGAPRLIGLTVTPDQLPRVKMTAPGKDMFIADTKRRIPIAIEARDDIGLASLKLRYTKVSGSGERFIFEEGEIPVAITRPDPRDWKATATLDLGPLALEQGDMVVYRGAATDGRPGAIASESDAFIVEITSPLSIAAEGFSIDDQQDKYALSQQMVILKTERLLARAATMSPESLTYHSQMIAAEQRSVRAEFVFMMGGEVAEEVIAAAGLADIDETKEAENESELAAGRMVNRGRIALVEAIRQMSRASTRLNESNPRDALPIERRALVALQEAFSRTRYLLRALTLRERLDLSRRLTGVLSLAARDSRPAPVATIDPAIASLRRALADIASCRPERSEGPAFAEEQVLRCAQDDIGRRILEVNPSDSTLQRVAQRLQEGAVDDAATLLASVLRARLPRAELSPEPAELRQLRGRMSDAIRRGGGR